MSVLQFFLTFRNHLHVFVGQSSPSFSSTICFQSCQLSFHMCSYIFPGVVDPSLYKLPPSSLPQYNHISILFLERLSSSLLLMCPYNRTFSVAGMLAYFDILLYDLVSDMVLSGLTPYYIHCSILISATGDMFSSFFLTAQLAAPYVIVGLITVLHILSFSLMGTFLSHSMPVSSFHFILFHPDVDQCYSLLPHLNRSLIPNT